MMPPHLPLRASCPREDANTPRATTIVRWVCLA